MTVKGKNGYLMGHKCIKESTVREMFGYFLANYHWGGDLGVCLSRVQAPQY